MTPAALAELLRAVAVDVLAERGLDVAALPETVAVQRPRHPGHGDYATNLALRSAGQAGVAPEELAGWLAARLEGTGAIAAAEVAGPGFLNLRLAAGAQAGVVADVLAAGEGYGHGDALAGQAATVGMPATPTDLRGARASAVGNALARLLATQGATVVRDHDHDAVLAAGPVTAPAHIRTAADLVDAVGADAARWALVRSPLDQVLEIDLDRISRRTVENPVFAVQWAHARLAATARHAADLGVCRDTRRSGAGPDGPVGDPDLALLTHPREGDLVRTLGELPRVLASAAGERAPHRVARYLEELAGAVHRFHDTCRVLPQGDQEPSGLHTARAVLCRATRPVLAGGLGLLGVTAPERT